MAPKEHSPCGYKKFGRVLLYLTIFCLPLANRNLNGEKKKHDLKYINEVKLCENIEGMLYYIYLECFRNKIEPKKYYEEPPAPSQRQMIDLMTPGTADFDLLRKLYYDVKEMSINMAPLKYTLQLNMEYQAILKTACSLLYATNVKSIQDPESGQDLNLKIIGGVISKSKWNAFEATLWRICHGNYVLQVSDIPTSDLDNVRRLFVVLVHGELLKNTVLKLTEGFSVILYDIPESKRKCSELYLKNKSEIADLKKVIANTNELYHRILKIAASNLGRWLIQVKKMKSIYHSMNKFEVDASDSFLVAECWIPQGNTSILNELLVTESKNAGGDIKPIIFLLNYTEPPPTYFRLNKLTIGFQNIIDAYGIASYKELNPMPYTVVTFPFLFALMFGDFGHAILLTLFSSFAIYWEKYFISKNSENEIWNLLFGGRYIILLMGLASMYTGLIYNDIFGLNMNIFGTSWKLDRKIIDASNNNEQIGLDPENAFMGKPYPFGMDPLWKMSKNEIDFYNSFKMKISVIFGVLQMTFGILLSFLNARYFKDYLTIVAELIPKLIFFIFLFGYLVFLIIIKWLTYGPEHGSGRASSCAPSVIISFIDMILFTSSHKLNPECDQNIFLFQDILEKILVCVSLVCVPWMLIVKPAVLIIRKKRQEKEYVGLKQKPRNSSSFTIYKSQEAFSREKYLGKAQSEPNLIKVKNENTYAEQKQSSTETGESFDAEEQDSSENSGSDIIIQSSEEENGTGEIIIHQCIHTIEFVLGSISYTASYLRLWALSLAHSQLSDVLWHMILRDLGLVKAGERGSILGAVFLLVMFYFWAVITVCVMCIMEGLSAFLHALRLHWMEFQSKFYDGQGYPFEPFSYKDIKDEVSQHEGKT